jgi:hypothetical protein
MRQFVFYLALVLCCLFVIPKITHAHPHKLGEMNHGPSLSAYNIKIDFSDNQKTQHETTTIIKLADKYKDDKQVSEKKLNKTKVKIKRTKTKKTIKRK